MSQKARTSALAATLNTSSPSPAPSPSPRAPRPAVREPGRASAVASTLGSPRIPAPARTVASILLAIGAVHIRPDQPFTFTSGRLSPAYVDCRKIISFPRARAQLMDMAVAMVAEAAGYEAFDAVAGGETAGIPFAAWMAERMGFPMLYVRNKPKGFGRNAQIEGDFADGARVLLVED